MYRITADNLTLEVALGDEDPGEVDNVDAWVVLPDGTKWAGTFLTLDAVARLMDRWRETGECLDGRFFYVRPDLVILRDRGVEEIFAVARELVASGDYRAALLQVDQVPQAE